MTSASPLERPDSPSQSRDSRDSPSLSTSRSKTVLFCPCGREAAPDEWPTERDGRLRLLVCPDCGETLTVR
jgi:hypothetical protein